MGKKWHTNKTKPKAYEEFVVITKDSHNFPQVELEMIRTDDFHRNIIPDEWWETVILWQYVDKLFAKEFKEIAQVEYEQISGAGFDTIRFHLGTDKILKVPENWGELLELCKTLKKVFISANEYYVEFNKLRFYKDGTVEFNGVIIKIFVGVSRMWQIIRNLIGEE